MSRTCIVTGKGVLSGNRRSHAMNATRRKWNPNLQTKKMIINGRPVRVKVSARGLKTLRKIGA